MKHRLVKNALSNLTRGGAAAVVALLLPPVLVRHMPAASYAVWVLALQAAAYVAYLDFGLQTAVGRYIAFANEKRDVALRDGIFSAAAAGLTIAGALGFLLVACIAAAAHRLFPSIPPPLLAPLRMTMLLVGASTALALPGSAWSGVFVGIQRYEIPALANGTGKLLSAIGLIWAAVTGKSLVLMGLIMALTNLYTYGLQILMQRRMVPEIHFHRSLISRPIVKELSGYCFSLTIWSFSMLLVSGFDLILVGRFQFSAVTPYSVSATLITFLAGVQIAIFGVMMPHAAQLHAQENPEALGRLLVKSTQVGVLLLLVTGLPLITFAPLIIKVWIGSQFARTGGSVLTVLVIANMIRLTGTPYASILLGTGQQRLVIVGPLAEGLSNLVASVLLGWKLGAIGVAWGTLAGSLIGVGTNIFYNLPRTRGSIHLSGPMYLSRALALPSLCGIPVCSVLLARKFIGISNSATMAALLVSCGCCVAFSLIANSGMRRFSGHQVGHIS